MKITPLRTGTIHCNKSILTLGRSFDDWLDIPATAWFVETAEHNILVDTGMCDTARACRYHYPDSRQQEEERIDRALARTVGIEPEKIDAVIFTHLHWDHCSNAAFFRNAAFYVQEEEVRFARNPLPPYFASYDSPAVGLEPSFGSLSLKTVQGDSEILPGISVIATPGHSPGHQSVVVRTGTKRYVIAGDAVMCFENLERDDQKGSEFRMIGRYMDFEKTWRSFRKIKEAGEFVLPAHDFRVFDRTCYE